MTLLPLSVTFLFSCGNSSRKSVIRKGECLGSPYGPLYGAICMFLDRKALALNILSFCVFYKEI